MNEDRQELTLQEQKHTVAVDSMDEVIRLFGVFDENLKVIEEETGAVIKAGADFLLNGLALGGFRGGGDGLLLGGRRRHDGAGEVGLGERGKEGLLAVEQHTDLLDVFRGASRKRRRSLPSTRTPRTSRTTSRRLKTLSIRSPRIPTRTPRRSNSDF